MMHFLHKSAFVVFIVISCAYSVEVTFKNCDDKSGSKVTIVDVVPCPTGPSNPCQIKRGSSIALKVTFAELYNATAVKSKVYGYIAGARVPFPLDQPNACTNCGLKCPLAAGTTYTFNSSLPVKQIYPKLKLVAEWQLVDDNNKEEFCFQVPLEII